jgi:hypothetical protein
MEREWFGIDTANKIDQWACGIGFWGWLALNLYVLLGTRGGWFRPTWESCKADNSTYTTSKKIVIGDDSGGTGDFRGKHVVVSGARAAAGGARGK